MEEKELNKLLQTQYDPVDESVIRAQPEEQRKFLMDYLKGDKVWYDGQVGETSDTYTAEQRWKAAEFIKEMKRDLEKAAVSELVEVHESSPPWEYCGFWRRLWWRWKLWRAWRKLPPEPGYGINVSSTK